MILNPSSDYPCIITKTGTEFIEVDLCIEYQDTIIEPIRSECIRCKNNYNLVGTYPN